MSICIISDHIIMLRQNFIIILYTVKTDVYIYHKTLCEILATNTTLVHA